MIGNSLDFYRNYHTHPINKLIHFICIPIIIFSFITMLHIHSEDMYRGISIIYYIGYWRYFGIIITLIMIYYFEWLAVLAKIFIAHTKYPFSAALLLLIGGFSLQFMGHIIEGNSPALMDSLSQAFFLAPVFTLEYAIPFLFR